MVRTYGTPEFACNLENVTVTDDDVGAHCTVGGVDVLAIFGTLIHLLLDVHIDLSPAVTSFLLDLHCSE